MRAAAFAIAIMLGGTALAQTAGTAGSGTVSGQMSAGAATAQPTGSTTATSSTMTGTTATGSTMGDQTQTGWNATSGQTGMQGQTNMAMNSTGAVVQPSNANPHRDERGVRVISAPAVIPSGYNGTQSTGTGGPLVDPTTGQAISETASTRACTRTVTDHCLQTYEHSRRHR
jgi:hypothetical protein